ncbi:sigma-70 family RNA polymerase sigma factor [Cellulosimicrobium marinum]|uniref:sigma-70 family RNA polymerase sigma factor n=1 Tax=Cellulosimicrobium marinum TaxID=1638992 RepID=UPI001E5F7FB0|nr:sigma-70 family RNA polymerase sigma factor [Cellulosimicrobium marinum]MCB7135578.1 sigma-70 family RNA polymerase sigma factor [Cellulosimicrobium marinum]
MTDVAAPVDRSLATPDDRPARDELDTALSGYRRELTGYCYRMLGSAFEAEDAVQDTFVRAWRSYDRFEGRSSLRSWLYRIATNVCFDALAARKRRERPMGLGGPQSADVENLGQVLPEETWVEPVPDDRVLPREGDPALVAVGRESIRLAFVAALQYLPPRQRAVLLLREVLRWQASEVAELLDTTVASVNSALQRARATLAARAHWDSAAADGEPGPAAPGGPDDAAPLAPATTDQSLGDEERRLLERYLDAFERYDMDALVAILHEDATLSMPPYPLWMRGTGDIVQWMVGPGWECEGSRLVPVRANGTFGFGQYRRAEGGGYEPWALQVIETHEGRVTAINAFLDTPAWFPLFGLPPRLDD